MGRAAKWLCLLAAVSAPAFAKSSESAGGSDGARAIRLASAFGVITSTYRSPAHNRAVGGVPNSYHLQARAIDIARRPGVTHRQIDAAFRAAGYNLIESLDEGDHSHLAFGPVTRRFATAKAVPPPQLKPPAPPATPRLAADQHGTLLVDLAAPKPAGQAIETGSD